LPEESDKMTISNDPPINQLINSNQEEQLELEFAKLFTYVQHLKESLNESGELENLRTRIRKISNESDSSEDKLGADLIELLVRENASFKQEEVIRGEQKIIDILTLGTWEPSVSLWDKALKGDVISHLEMQELKGRAVRELDFFIGAMPLVDSLRKELRQFITSLLHLIELKEKAKFTRIRGGFSIELSCFEERVAVIPSDSRVPYDVGILSEGRKLRFDVFTHGDKVKLNVNEHLRMWPVTEEKIESILESFSNMIIPNSFRSVSRFLPTFIQELLLGDGNGLRAWLRNKAEENLRLVDGEIIYREFSFFLSKGYFSNEVRMTATRNDAIDPESLRKRELSRQNLIANSYAERFARSAMNWGRMLLLPEGGNAKYINTLFAPAEEGGRLTYRED
jgi:hypothetical protein